MKKLIVILAIVITSCSSDDSSVTITEALTVGQWELTELRTDAGDVFTDVEPFILTLGSDNTFEWERGYTFFSGNYNIIPDPEDGDYIEFSISTSTIGLDRRIVFLDNNEMHLRYYDVEYLWSNEVYVRN